MIPNLKKQKWHAYTLPSHFLSIKLALFLFLGELLISIGGFMILEEYNLREAFYMTIIMVSTVGFREVRPLGESGQLFASIMIIINVGIFAYLLSVFSYYIVQGEIFKNMQLSMINKKIDKIKDHVILCGYGRHGMEVSEHFFSHNVPFVVIDVDPERIEILRASENKFLYIEGDATNDEILEKAGVHRAKALVTALPDDSENVLTVITAKNLDPHLNVISRASEHRSLNKLKRAGANHVIMPEQIGGFYMAALVNKPGAVEFFSFVTDEYESDIGFEEVTYEDLPESCKLKSLSEMGLRQATGANIIGYKNPLGKYSVNPTPDTILSPGSSFIALGSLDQLSELNNFLKKFEE